MILSILSVDGDIKNFHKLKLVWEKRSIIFSRADSMQNALARLENENFFFIGINGDSIDFWLQLKILREAAQCPIFILTSHVTVHELIQAYELGADMYWFWRDEETCAQVGMSLAQRFHDRGKQNRKPPKIITHGEITIIPSYRMVLGNDKEILLAESEFDILHYLMINRGQVLSYRQISRHVWKEEYDENSPDIIWSVVKRMRKKLRETMLKYEYIENVRGIGYRFPIILDKNT